MLPYGDHVSGWLNHRFVFTKCLAQDPLHPVSEDGLPVPFCDHDAQSAECVGRRLEYKLVGVGVHHHILGMPFDKFRPFGNALLLREGFAMRLYRVRRQAVSYLLPGDD